MSPLLSSGIFLTSSAYRFEEGAQSCMPQFIRYWDCVAMLRADKRGYRFEDILYDGGVLLMLFWYSGDGYKLVTSC